MLAVRLLGALLLKVRSLLAESTRWRSFQHPHLKVDAAVDRHMQSGARLAQAAADRSPVVALAVLENSRRLILRKLFFLLLAVALRESEANDDQHDRTTKISLDAWKFGKSKSKFRFVSLPQSAVGSVRFCCARCPAVFCRADPGSHRSATSRSRT